jgi:ABC-type branched-subunit amino acid transport system substrate-binding protein
MVSATAKNLVRLCVCLATLVAGRLTAADPPAAELVVGMSAAFRGPARGLSIELYRGSIAYLNHINESGGVYGRRITLKAHNDGYDPIPAIDNTIQLVEQENAFLLFDYMGSPTTTRVLPLLKKYHDSGRHVYLFFPFTGAEPLRQPPYNEFVFNLRASYHQETAALVDHLVAIGRKRLAVFYQIDAYGRSGWDGVRKALAKFDTEGKLLNGAESAAQTKLKIVAEASYQRGTNYATDLKPQVDILRAADPDAVISVGTYAACAAFIREARDAGWNVPIANVSGVNSENLLALLKESGEARSRDYTGNLINSQIVPSYENLDLPAVREYRDLMDKYQPMPPDELLDEPYRAPRYSAISCEGFLNAKALVEILKRLGPDPKQENIRDVVESISTLDLGIKISASFNRQRHQGLDAVYFTVVSDGRIVPATDEDWQRWRK